MGTYSDRLWNVRSLNRGRLHPGLLHAADGDRTAVLPGLLGQREPRSTPKADDGRLRRRQVPGRRRRAHRARHAEIQRPAAQRAAHDWSNGFSVSANYTLSKCNGHPTQGARRPTSTPGYVNPDDIDYDYGPCDSDRRHLFNLTASAETPRFDERGRCARWRRTGGSRASSAPTRGHRSR